MDTATEKKKPRPRFDLRRDIRRRAWEIASSSYADYCKRIQEALDAGEIKPAEIDSWTPAK